MWSLIERHHQSFTSAVLSTTDGDGFPLSVRCYPRLDRGRQVLLLPDAPVIAAEPGPACLLYHRHDERLASLKSLVVVGQLEHDTNGWILRPVRVVPGVGLSLAGYLRFLIDGRRRTKQYLAKRDLPRPQIPWAELRAWLEVE